MQTMVIKYVVVLITSVVLDSIWLGLVANGFYKKYLGALLSPTPNLAIAGLFYLVFAVGVLVFILNPALAGGWSAGKAFLYGALLGLVIYGGYDFTNQALIKDWPLMVTIADLAWGTTMSCLASGISFLIIRAFV